MEKIWAKEPAWLEKKRQLATMLQSRFPALAGQEEWLDYWQKGDVYSAGEGWLDIQDDNLTALPLEQAVNRYSPLLQESLMEKAIFWQDDQLAAHHLTQIDCGQFIYIPSGSKLSHPLIFNPHLSSTNPHNIILIGADAEVVIEERMVNKTSLPSYEATEILVGPHAHVIYRQANTSTSENVYRGIHAYQAHGSHLNFEIASQSYSKATLDLYSFLDGEESQWNTQVALKGRQKISAMVDGFGKKTTATLTTFADDHLISGEPFKVKSGEPLEIHETNYPLTQLVGKDNWLKRAINAI